MQENRLSALGLGHGGGGSRSKDKKFSSNQKEVSTKALSVLWTSFLDASQLDALADSQLPSDILHLDASSKTAVVRVMLARKATALLEDLSDALREYSDARRLVRELDSARKADILRNKRIVGLTITGASINRDLLQAVRPSIVFVEEAAEILEPQLLACLSSSTKKVRFSLIG